MDQPPHRPVALHRRAEGAPDGVGVATVDRDVLRLRSGLREGPQRPLDLPDGADRGGLGLGLLRLRARLARQQGRDQRVVGTPRAQAGSGTSGDRPTSSSATGTRRARATSEAAVTPRAPPVATTRSPSCSGRSPIGSSAVGVAARVTGPPGARPTSTTPRSASSSSTIATTSLVGWMSSARTVHSGHSCDSVFGSPARAPASGSPLAGARPNRPPRSDTVTNRRHGPIARASRNAPRTRRRKSSPRAHHREVHRAVAAGGNLDPVGVPARVHDRGLDPAQAERRGHARREVALVPGDHPPSRRAERAGFGGGDESDGPSSKGHRDVRGRRPVRGVRARLRTRAEEIRGAVALEREAAARGVSGRRHQEGRGLPTCPRRSARTRGPRTRRPGGRPRRTARGASRGPRCRAPAGAGASPGPRTGSRPA